MLLSFPHSAALHAGYWVHSSGPLVATALGYAALTARHLK